MGITLEVLVAGRVSPEQLLDSMSRDAVAELLTGGDARARRMAWQAIDRIADQTGFIDLAERLVAELDNRAYRLLLTDADARNRRRTWDALTGNFPPADRIYTTLEVLADGSASRAWNDCAEILRRAQSMVDYELVTAAMTSDKSFQARLYEILGVPKRVPLPEIALDAAVVQCHRCTGESEELIAAQACPHLPVYLQLTTSPLWWTRSSAVRELVYLGPGIRTALHTLRRSSHPARRARCWFWPNSVGLKCFPMTFGYWCG
ncbi:hypothetical protein AB0C65_31965 [Nocardia sp. NPDC048505]|uniref:hypothetical protein n=1 Tax=Nocardia sp. NPDC048505 TaxID=3155756 RepID=UPI0033F81333